MRFWDRLSISTCEIGSSRRHSSTNSWQTGRSATPLSLRKSAITLKIGGQSTGQPHQLYVPLRLALQATSRLNTTEVTVDVDLQRRGRMVVPTTRGLRDRPVKAQRGWIQVVEEDVHDPHQVVFCQVVVEALGQQGSLREVFTFHKTSYRQRSSALASRCLDPSRACLAVERTCVRSEARPYPDAIFCVNTSLAQR